ncbi:djr-1.1 [Pristionchus pacificus]|nr:djr-1.1 [Pristionchus pacificus]
MALRRALILLADGAEEMEVIITSDVLRRAGIEVTLGGLFGMEPITCARKARLLPDASVDEAAKEKHDVIILPGGLPGSETLAKTAKVGDILRSQLSCGGFIAAICAAPIAFASHSIQKGATLTSFPGVRGKLEEAGYNYSEDRVVVDGKMITSRGPGTAFEFALKLVEILVSAEESKKLHEGMLLK